MKNIIKRLGTLAIATMMFASASITAQAAFDDADSSSTWDWAWKHIDWAESKEIVAGKANNCFDADGLVTRAEAVTMMVKFKEIDTAQYDIACEKFEDVGEEWYTKFINAAYANGLVSGKTETIFDPEGQLTRAEAAAMIVNAMGYEKETEAENAFTDIDGDWYTDCINTAYAHEIVSGKGEGIFDPNANVTRAEFVAMVHAIMYECFELDMIYNITVGYNALPYSLTNDAGQVLNYNGETHSGELLATTDVVVSFGGSGTEHWTEESSSFTYELTDDTSVCEVTFWGDNAWTCIEGTNIEKVKANADGTICLYGTDMEYTITLKNEKHEVEYSATSANDVILKVVDKQFVEVTE